MWRSFLVLAALSSAVIGEETCLYSEQDPYLRFGTKTAYNFVVSGRSHNRVEDVLGCTPIAFWMLTRHGSHNPEADEIDQLQQLQDFKINILNNYQTFRNHNGMCPADQGLLRTWSWNSNHNRTFAGDLTSEGYVTTQHVAQGWQQRFPALLLNSKQDHYLFRHVNDRRSSVSFQAFAEGIFKGHVDIADIPKRNDSELLQPYKSCPRWSREVENNNETYRQLKIFESKMEFKEMISNISQRLGFSYDIDNTTVHKMYQMCRYDKAWNIANVSPWCAAFTKEDLKRLEYAEDLDSYYKYGYGSDLNQNLGCGIIKDMLDFFQKHVQNENSTPIQPRVQINLADAPLVLLAHTALGSHKGRPLTGDNYRTQGDTRKWTSSTISPFNANIAAVLHKCDTKRNYLIQQQYQVLFLENEQQMVLDGCRAGLCDWATVQEKYKSLTENCNLDQLCNRSSNLFSNASLLLTSFLVIFRYFC